ncbi:MAG TPA: hypothetical protein VJH55_00875 [Candidatus Paceibacterota bacterium]
MAMPAKTILEALTAKLSTEAERKKEVEQAQDEFLIAQRAWDIENSLDKKLRACELEMSDDKIVCEFESKVPYDYYAERDKKRCLSNEKKAVLLVTQRFETQGWTVTSGINSGDWQQVSLETALLK